MFNLALSPPRPRQRVRAGVKVRRQVSGRSLIFTALSIAGVAPKGRKPLIHLKPVRLNWACPSCDFIDDKLGEVFRRSALERDARDTELVHPAGVSIAWLVASLSFLTISLGAPFGRKKAFQVTTSKSVSPCSCAVGKSGISGERLRDSVATAFICLPTISGAAPPMLRHM